MLPYRSVAKTLKIRPVDYDRSQFSPGWTAYLVAGGPDVDTFADLSVELEPVVINTAVLNVVVDDFSIRHPVPHADALHTASVFKGRTRWGES